jgi:ribosomal protein L32
MALKKCDNCGKFFGGDTGEALCEDCRSSGKTKMKITGDLEHDKFTNARALVYDNPHISPVELAEELTRSGIPTETKEILKFVSEGRLTLVTIDGGTYCNSCGRKIMIGTMCKDCSDKLDRFRKPASQPKSVEQAKNVGMHTKK